MNKFIFLIFFYTTFVFADDLKTKQDAIDFCLTIHDEGNTPKIIQELIKEKMTKNCFYDERSDGNGYYVSAASFYKLYDLDDISNDNKKDFILILGSSGNGGNYYSLLVSNDENYDEIDLGMTQGLYFNKKENYFIYSTHGSACDQSGHIPCFFIRPFDGKQIADPQLIKDYAERHGKPWDSKDENLLSLDAD